MYTGHFGIALAGKGIEQRVPLWVFIVAVFAPDLVVSLSQLLIGVEKQVLEPVISSLAGGLSLGVIAGLIFWGFTRNYAGSFLIGFITFSHVLADLITGRLLLWPGGPKTGLHLYQYEYADFALETSLVIGGWLLYHRTLPKEKQRTWPAWMILVVLVSLQLYFEIRPII